MPTNREWAAAFGVLQVAWVLLGFAGGFFANVSSSFIWTDFLVTLLVLIFTPAIMSHARWTAPGAMIVGAIRIIATIMGLVLIPTSKAYGPVVALVLALLFTYFSYRGYKQK